MFRLSILCACVLTGAIIFNCGDRSAPNGDPRDGGSAQDANPRPADASIDMLFWPDTALSTACGQGSPCGSESVCVHPCCGGAPPACLPKTDAGVCPPGTTDGCQINAFPNGEGCQMDPCQPPPPFCEKKAALPEGCEFGADSTTEVFCLCA